MMALIYMALHVQDDNFLYLSYFLGYEDMKLMLHFLF